MGSVESLAAFLQTYQEHPCPVEKTRDARVLAVLELRDTRRRWYVVSAEKRDGKHLLVGYEPPCRYAPDDGWFVLPSDFFLRAALATGDSLDVRTDCIGSIAQLDLAEAC